MSYTDNSHGHEEEDSQEDWEGAMKRLQNFVEKQNSGLKSEYRKQVEMVKHLQEKSLQQMEKSEKDTKRMMLEMQRNILAQINQS